MHIPWYTCRAGLQIVAVALRALLQRGFGVAISLNDVCVLMPVWFGAVATAFTALLTYECSDRSLAAAVGASAVMAIVPAHLLRSVGGGQSCGAGRHRRPYSPAWWARHQLCPVALAPMQASTTSRLRCQVRAGQMILNTSLAPSALQHSVLDVRSPALDMR